MTCEPIPLSMVERLQAHNLYLCVRVDGEDDDGTPRYAYFGIFLEDFQKLVQHLRSNAAMNPKDFRAIVLARSSGTPSPETLEFMRLKFSFADGVHQQAPVLEVSR